MAYRVVVWGTGNVGRPAIRAIASHRDLELVDVIVSNPAKVGKDAGELAGMAPLGVKATDDIERAFADDVDCVFYAATADLLLETVDLVFGTCFLAAATSSVARSGHFCPQICVDRRQITSELHRLLTDPPELLRLWLFCLRSRRKH